ncbi:metal ABC transporter substrate-binding protein [Sporolactobacillus sp. THM7-4]|nr:metal ABC transporter substrate-binding protein [Sporolactobacillus sp. THM7-4]
MKTQRFARQSILLFGLFLFILAVLAGCGKAPSGQGGSSKVRIVAAENFYGEVAQAVGGNHVQVTSVIHQPNMDPHEFEPTPYTARAVSDAQLVIDNGIGYDSWMDDLVSSGNKNKKVIHVAEDVMKQKLGDNEHQWYNPETMPKLATTIAGALAKTDPAHARDYHRNAKDYQASIKPVGDWVEKLSRKSDNGKVDVSEPIFDNMLKALGYRTGNNHFKMAVEEGTDPSPRDITQTQKDIEKKKIVFFVNNIQESSPTVEKMVALARKNKVPVLEVTETLPKGKTYKTWMLDILKRIEKIQNGRS